MPAGLEGLNDLDVFIRLARGTSPRQQGERTVLRVGLFFGPLFGPFFFHGFGWFLFGFFAFVLTFPHGNSPF